MITQVDVTHGLFFFHFFPLSVCILGGDGVR